jgi:chromate reductase, NAD(P)H dehydrogenase (quinone)
MPAPKILAFAGSVRKESFNRKLLRIAVRAAEEAGARVTLIELADYSLPLFDQDLEATAYPENAGKLKQLFLEHDGLLIAAPEYNSSITPLTKNTIDWVSRSTSKGEPSVAAFRGKVAGLVSASPSQLGGLRGLVHLRAILGNISVLVVPEQATVPVANEAFNENGFLKDPKRTQAVENVAKSVVTVLSKLKG